MEEQEGAGAIESASDEVARYARNKRIEDARGILQKTKIYLDTKYWVLFRDVRLGRSTSSSIATLLERVEALVNAGKAICPLNADVYFEVFKQQDPLTLTASVQLLDDLSGGACLLPMTERLKLEVAHFMATATHGSSKVFQLDELVWTRPAYIIGFVTPDCHELPRDQNVMVQKRFVDHMWTMTLTDMLKVMGVDKAAKESSPFKDISGQLNQGKFDHADEHKSFKSVFLSEVQGIVDVYKSDFADYMRYTYERQTGKRLSDQARADDRPGLQVANLVYQAFLNNRISNQFPTIRIGAGLHAALRWDRKRKYKANDIFDFRHAEAALPYCDYFLTERSLRNLVQDRHLEFETHFKCRAYSDPDEALAALEKADGPSDPPQSVHP